MILYKYYPPIGAELTLEKLRWKVALANSANDAFECLPTLPEGVSYSFAIQDIKRFQDQASSEFGFVSFSKTPPVSQDAILMWSHYTDNHSGCVVSFDMGSGYLKQFEQAAGILLRPIEVKYQEQRTRFKRVVALNSEEVKEIFEVKSKCWAYEQEVRLFRPILKGDFNELLKKREEELAAIVRQEQDGSKVIDEKSARIEIRRSFDFLYAQKITDKSTVLTCGFPKESLHSITFGVRAEDSFIDKILGIMRSHELSPKISHLKLHERDFGFEEMI